VQLRKSPRGWPYHEAWGAQTCAIVVRESGVILSKLTAVGRGGLWVIPGVGAL